MSNQSGVIDFSFLGNLLIRTGVPLDTTDLARISIIHHSQPSFLVYTYTHNEQTTSTSWATRPQIKLLQLEMLGKIAHPQTINPHLVTQTSAYPCPNGLHISHQIRQIQHHHREVGVVVREGGNHWNYRISTNCPSPLPHLFPL